MLTNMFSFIRDENGAVTVDWIVLTAVIVSFGLLILIPISNAITVAADNIEVTAQAPLN